jgi:hypothetical protein
MLDGNPKGQRQFGRPRRRLEDNIRANIKETGNEGVDNIQLTHYRIQ